MLPFIFALAFPTLFAAILRSRPFCRTHGLHRLETHGRSCAFAVLGTKQRWHCAVYCAAIPCHAILCQSTLFVAFVVYDARRQEAGRLDCCCCFKTKDMHKRPSAAASVIDPTAEWVRICLLSPSTMCSWVSFCDIINFEQSIPSCHFPLAIGSYAERVRFNILIVSCVNWCWTVTYLWPLSLVPTRNGRRNCTA